jgi:lipopolysaccharide/colanic/teichoic acid biosynthesis glycosyltransferase
VTVLLIILGALGALVVAVLHGLSADEARGRIRRYVLSRVDATIAAMPAELRSEWEEEWRGEAEAALTMPLSALLFPRGLRQSARRLTAERLAVALTTAAAPPGNHRAQVSDYRFELTRPARLMKRTLDVVVAAVALVAVAPVLAVLAVSIKLDSPGPVLSRQTRMGGRDAPFEMLRFRSVIAGADVLNISLPAVPHHGGRLLATNGELRITRLGRLLQVTGLVDLPQLFNVLSGSMSLVGPRPLAVDVDRRVFGVDGWHLTLRPGLAGHWQANGRSRITAEDMLRVDYLYVANWSLWGDLRIIIATIAGALRSR